MESKYLTWCLFGSLICFTANTVGHKAIFGGVVTPNHTFRYQVLLRVDGSHECGGGILDDHHILTAARCVIQNDGHTYDNHITIVAGMNRIREGRIFSVGIIRVPAQYIPQQRDSLADFAVLKLSHSMRSTYPGEFLRIKLPSDNRDLYAAGDTAWIAGIESMEEHSNSIVFAETEIISHQECQQAYHTTRPRRTIDNSHQICARIKRRGNAYRGVCVGDEGGPLVLHDGIVIGVLSLITPLCDETHTNLPAIYTRVSSYRQHIFNYTRGIGGTIHRVPINIAG